MKFSAIIGSIGLGILGLVAAGCSAETAESGEIGSVSSPLQLAAQTAIGNETAFAASCVLDSKVLVAGGYDDTAAGIRDVRLYNPADNTWDDTVTDLPENQGRGEAKMIAIPGTDKCVLVGGRTSYLGSTFRSQAYVFDLSDNAWTTAGTLSRVGHKISVCGTNTGDDSGSPAKIIVVAGRSDSSTVSDRIHVWDANSLAFTELTTATVKLSSARELFGLAAKDTNYTEFLIAGGSNGSSALKSVDIMKVSTACVLDTNAMTRDLNPGDVDMGTGFERSGTEAFLYNDDGDSTFLVAGGYDGSSAVSTTRKIVVADWSTGDITVSAGAAMATARNQPTLVAFPNGKSALIGGFAGLAGVGTSVTVPDVQVWDAANATPAWDTDDENLPEAPVGAAAEYVSGVSTAVIVGGREVTLHGMTGLPTVVDILDQVSEATDN